MKTSNTGLDAKGKLKFKFNLNLRNGRDFFICGMLGWVMECLWTGLNSIFCDKDSKLTCRTSIWMFPIYGLAALIGPISKRLKHRPKYYRGILYTILIYLVEFFSGKFLRKLHCCPWDYSKAHFNLSGLIRFDYAPLWYVVGLFYEKLLNKSSQI